MRRQLIEMREDRGLSRERLAYEIEVNVRTVCRWEAGERTPQMAQRVRLAEALGRPLADVLRALRNHHDGNGEPLTGHAVSGHLTHYESLEQAATVLHAFETLAVPGLLQTAAYATSVERASIAHPTAAEVARRVEFRLRRQQVLRREPEPLGLYALLDGSVLLRETGGPVVMAARLDHLRVMNERPTSRSGSSPSTAGSSPRTAPSRSSAVRPAVPTRPSPRASRASSTPRIRLACRGLRGTVRRTVGGRR